MKIMLRSTSFKPVIVPIRYSRTFIIANDNMTADELLAETKRLCHEVCRGLIAAGFNFVPTGNEGLAAIAGFTEQ